MKREPLFAFGVLLALSVGTSAFSGEAEVRDDGGVIAVVDGVEFEWNPDGSFRRLYSRYSTPVEFPDRRGINKAQIISEEKAKANIIRTLEQISTSTRIVAEVQADINLATQKRKSNSSYNSTKIDERTVAETLTEITTSFAAGTLRGVIVLERGYNEEFAEAWVVVGISEKTIAASQSLGQTLRSGSVEQGISGRSGGVFQNSEIRRSGHKDW